MPVNIFGHLPKGTYNQGTYWWHPNVFPRLRRFLPVSSPDELVQHVHVPQGGLGGCLHVETLVPLRGMLGLSEIVPTRMFEQFIEAMKVPTNS